MKYMKYITELEFETKPNYSYLRNLFLHSSQDGNIPTCLYNMKEPNENLTSSIFFERPYLRERKPCRPVNGEVNIYFFKFKVFTKLTDICTDYLILFVLDTNNTKYTA